MKLFLFTCLFGLLVAIAGEPASAQNYTLSPILSGQGTVTSVDGKINCTRNSSGLTGTCSATYASGTTVTMNATAAAGWTFSTWSSATQSGCMAGNPCVVTMTQNLSPTATFVQTTYTLSPILSGQGTVTSVDGKINCTRNSSGLTGTCSATYASGTTVTMNATAAVGWTFSTWSSATQSGCMAGNPCTVTMNQSLSPTATFVVSGPSYTLSPNLVGQGTVTSTDGKINCTRNSSGLTGTCSATYASGTTVTMNATAASGWTFQGWSGFCSGGNPCVLVMNQNLSPTATFTGGYTLSPILSGQGTVTSTDGNIDCTRNATGLTGTCSATYANGATVTMNATAASGWIFSAWSSYADSTCNGGNPCVVTMNQNLSPTATFDQLTGLQSEVTFNSVTAENDTGSCPSGTSPTGACFSIQQNFYVFKPNATIPSLWAQNIVKLWQTKGGVWKILPLYQIFTVDSSCVVGTIFTDEQTGSSTSIPEGPFSVTLYSVLAIDSNNPKLEDFFFSENLNGSVSLGDFTSRTTVPLNSSISAVPDSSCTWPYAYEPELALVSLPKNGLFGQSTTVTFASSTSGSIQSYINLASEGQALALQGPFTSGSVGSVCSSTNEQSTGLQWSADGSTFSSSEPYLGEGVDVVPSGTSTCPPTPATQ